MHGVLAAADALDEQCVALLGDAAYYSRFGFEFAEPSGVYPPEPPLFLMADSADPLVLDFPYADDGPQRFTDQVGSYAVSDAPTTHNTTTEYGHSLAEIITAAIASGLVIDHLGEHLAVETDGHRGLATRDGDGLMCWRHTGQPLPIMFSLRARKP